MLEKKFEPSGLVDWRLPVSNQILQNLIGFLDFKV